MVIAAQDDLMFRQTSYVTVMPRQETFQFLLNLGGPIGAELRQSKQGLL